MPQVGSATSSQPDLFPTDVDARDIRDVCANDLHGYTQCHFFAGIGLWPYALREAGWTDNRPVWTGSCPCQPFSSAGKGLGFADERHLWPAWHWLIDQLRPDVIFGEQVADQGGLMWLDLVSSDLEACGYACGSVDFPSAGVGAPNRRQRLYWVADAESRGCGEHGILSQTHGIRQATGQLALGGEASARRLGVAEGVGSPAGACLKNVGHVADQSERPSDASRLGNACNAGLPNAEPQNMVGSGRRDEGRAVVEQPSGPLAPWRQPEWVECTDRRRRPFEPGSFPLAARRPGDVAKLRAYGNAINPIVAEQVIRAYLEARL